MTEAHLHIEPRFMESGRPVILWLNDRILHAAYDPDQIGEAAAIAAIALLAPGMPDITSVTRASDSGETFSAEDIAEHGHCRRTGNSRVSTAYKEA